MTYAEAKQALREASGMWGGGFFRDRLLESPDRLSPIDSSTQGALPEGDSFADDVFRALMVVQQHTAGDRTLERDLVSVLVELWIHARLLALDEQNSETRIPQIVMVCEWIFHSTAYGQV